MSDMYLVQNDDGKWEKADLYDMDNPIEALTKAYQQGRADAIDEYVSILKKELDFCEKYGELVVKLAEQLKEQKNE